MMKTDQQLQQDVIAELAWEPAVNAGLVGVKVKDGIVTLAGHVGTFSEKWEAERAAQRVSGVLALVIDMEVMLSAAHTRTDGDIARAAEHVLHSTVRGSQDPVKIMVEHGWITLTGEVNWDYQRQATAHAMRGLIGVTGINDQIRIKPDSSSMPIQADIEAALKRRMDADARQIVVAVSGADVTLSGTVRSWSARESARTSAWGTPGVRSVADNLTIAG